MICPKCGKEIKRVNIVSSCWRKADVDESGTVTDYGSIEEVLETMAIEHRDNDCFADLTSIVKEP